MAAFTREQRRLAWAGIKLTGAIDDLPIGKYGFAQNVRSYEVDQVTARPGVTNIGAVAGPVTGLERFDDPTPFATNPHLYIVGGSVNVYTSVVGSGVFNNVDTGYSGQPLSFVTATPPQAAQPWLYVFDRSRARKFDANGHVFEVGLRRPTQEPTAALQQMQVTPIQQFSGAFVPWTLIGAATGPITSPNRVLTTVFNSLYDNNHNTVFTAPGYASIIPVSINNISKGMLLGITPGDDVIVTDVNLAVATTIIAAILYDAGVTGYCTIQPLASLGTGQIEAPSQQDYAARFIPTPGDVPPEPDPLATTNARVQQVDFPVNCLIALNGGEVVRIESVALGPDGRQSLRCFTTATHFTGESIQGVASFRAYQTFGHAPGDVIQDATLTHILPGGTDVVGGVRTGAGWAGANLSQVGFRATLPDDDITLACRVSLVSQVQTVRMYLSLNPTGGSAPSDADFLNNYFLFEWRANDIQAAVQSQNAALVESLQDTRFLAVGNAQINQDLTVDVQGVLGATAGGYGVGTAAAAASQMLQLGNLQYLTLKCKVRDLTRIGTDPSLSLARVTAAELLVHQTGANPITVDWDALLLTGGFGPDTGTTATPYVAMYRYRASRTGSISNPSPPLRGGVTASRQRIQLNHSVTSDPQVDLVDWFVLGATLNRWVYAGTCPIGQPFNLDLADSSLGGGDSPDYDKFQPWPTQDAPKKGICNVVGNALQWVSGDQFNTNWSPGSEIIIGDSPPAVGGTYTLYSQPPTALLLFTNENIGNQNGVPFTVKSATLLNQIMSSAWGGPIAGATFLFACGDPINPGVVHWTNPNDPETAAETNSLDVSTGDEPLQGGFMDDGVSYVASTERIIRLEPSFGSLNPFTPVETDCHRGFWTSYSFDRGMKGEYFLSRDGIYVTSGGSTAVSITDEDLYPLFPHDGQPGVAVNTIQPPNMNQPVLYLSCDDGWVYFDYVDILGASHTLAYRELDGAWHYDTFAQGITARNQASGSQVHQMLSGAANGTVYVSGGQTDDSVPFVASLQWVQNQKDARRQKLYRDLMLDGQNLDPVTVTIGFTNNTVVLAGVPLAGAGPTRTQQDINTTLQTGNFGTNLTTLVQWTPGATPTILYVWDIAFQPAPELASSWLSGPTTHGQRSFQQVKQIVVAYLSTTPVTFSLIVDGVAKTYNLPSSGGIYAKIPVILQSVKGMAFQYGFQSSTPFMLFDSDFEAWVSVWGEPGGYQIVRPF